MKTQKQFCYKYPHPALTTDCVVFGFDGKTLHILLIERGLEPFKGSWALPGGFMRMNETLGECARRELLEETGVNIAWLQQFHTFSGIHRDPRERVVTTAFFALVRKSDYKLIAGDDAAKAQWFELSKLPPLAFDHKYIVEEARRYIREELRIRPIAFRLLDKVFTMPELQNVWEAITGHRYDRRNFSRKMLSSGKIDEVKSAFRHPDSNSSSSLQDDETEDLFKPKFDTYSVDKPRDPSKSESRKYEEVDSLFAPKIRTETDSSKQSTPHKRSPNKLFTLNEDDDLWDMDSNPFLL